jgi:hypothetical protein
LGAERQAEPFLLSLVELALGDGMDARAAIKL